MDSFAESRGFVLRVMMNYGFRRCLDTSGRSDTCEEFVFGTVTTTYLVIEFSPLLDYKTM
jgi:hypothetical protein